MALVLPVSNMIDTLSVDAPNIEKQSEEIDFDPVHDVKEVHPWEKKREPTAYDLHPDSFGGEDFPPLVTPEEATVINNFYKANPQLSLILKEWMLVWKSFILLRVGPIDSIQKMLGSKPILVGVLHQPILIQTLLLFKTFRMPCLCSVDLAGMSRSSIL